MTSHTYLFAIRRLNLREKCLYSHLIDTPASILTKEAIHILPDHIPEVNRREKYAAAQKIMERNS